ncbi:hypothetical protein SteCoe_9127 [Stentor coeruleus]|uniref:Uncharacterized protein n=1 Tax=Stentor coeruleus TaxID=5963 RepID=A0A1R2CIJ5_9CILI|nr:hypothetical protein SteCoe_9127 [Stentor coeruleus]
MVILSHLLKSSLSNTSSSLTLIIEDKQFTGLGKVIWLNSVHNFQGEKEILISENAFLGFLGSLSVSSMCPPSKISLSDLSTNKLLCIDSLEYLDWLIGTENLYKTIQKRAENGLGTLAVINKSYMGSYLTEKYSSLASILAIVNKYSNCKGQIKCVHSRGYCKFTEEFCAFEVVGDVVKEIKGISKPEVSVGPKSTFRLGVSEEEKKMREITPLPYEKTQGIIVRDQDDRISEDEEGDDDDYYELNE